jgi:magnesium transporter
MHVASDGTRRRLADGDTIPTDGWFWLDVTGQTAADAADLGERFDLDRLTVDDIGDGQLQFPKVDHLGHYLFVVTHSLATDATALRTVEVDHILGHRWLVTTHTEPLASIDAVWDRCAEHRFGMDGPDHLMARLIEFDGQRFLPILDALDIEILELEEVAIAGDPSVLTEVQALRRDVAVLRRVLSPQRNALLALVRDEDARLSGVSRRELSDAFDHHMRLVESLDSAHLMLATVLDTYRGATAERMNEVMKVLTVFSAIVLPLTLIAGIYGMNFEHMPELAQEWAYPATLVAMAAIGVGLWLYFVRRGFIGGPKLRTIARPAAGAVRLGKGLAWVAALPVKTVGSLVLGLEDNRSDARPPDRK